MEVWQAADQGPGTAEACTLSKGEAIEGGMGKDVGLSDDVGHEPEAFGQLARESALVDATWDMGRGSAVETG
jgi:hypothetical protein